VIKGFSSPIIGDYICRLDFFRDMKNTSLPKQMQLSSWRIRIYYIVNYYISRENKTCVDYVRVYVYVHDGIMHSVSFHLSVGSVSNPRGQSKQSLFIVSVLQQPHRSRVTHNIIIFILSRMRTVMVVTRTANVLCQI